MVSVTLSLLSAYLKHCDRQRQIWTSADYYVILRDWIFVVFWLTVVIIEYLIVNCYIYLLQDKLKIFVTITDNFCDKSQCLVPFYKFAK